MLLSVVIALNPTNLITSLMSLSWGCFGRSVLGPFLYGLFWKGVTRAAVWASFAVGVLLPASNLFFHFTSPTNAGAISILASLVVVPLVSLVTPKLKKELVEDAFSCYKEPVTVSHVVALEEKSE